MKTHVVSVWKVTIALTANVPAFQPVFTASATPAWMLLIQSIVRNAEIRSQMTKSKNYSNFTESKNISKHKKLSDLN